MEATDQTTGREKPMGTLQEAARVERNIINLEKRRAKAIATASRKYDIERAKLLSSLDTKVIEALRAGGTDVAFDRALLDAPDETEDDPTAIAAV